MPYMYILCILKLFLELWLLVSKTKKKGGGTQIGARLLIIDFKF